MRLLIVGLASIAIVAATRHGSSGTAAQTPAQPAAATVQGPTMVAHPQHIQPGLAPQQSLTSLMNPYEGDAQRMAEGGKLYIAYNCIDCHGAEGSGFMGPSFQDNRWHFGGTAGEVFQSIYEGRPEGMPAWGGRIGDDQIWRLVAYVRSLSKGHDVATENFTGRTVKRMGH